MSDERDHDVQDWFKHSVEDLPRQPFTLAVLKRVRYRERRLRLQRYAARFVAFVSFCLLLPTFIALLNMLAALPLALHDPGGEQAPFLVIAAAGVGYWLHNKARNMGLLRGA